MILYIIKLYGKLVLFGRFLRYIIIYGIKVQNIKNIVYYMEFHKINSQYKLNNFNCKKLGVQ